MTEFHYRIFHEPEVLPAIVLVYIDDYSDLWKFEAALNDGRYHLCLHTAYFFTPPKFDKWVRAKSIYYISISVVYIYIYIYILY